MNHKNRRRAGRLRSGRLVPGEIMELRMNLSAGLPAIAAESVLQTSDDVPSIDRESFRETFRQSASAANMPEQMYDMVLDHVDSPDFDPGIHVGTTANPESQQDLTPNSPSWPMSVGTTTVPYVSFYVFTGGIVVPAPPLPADTDSYVVLESRPFRDAVLTQDGKLVQSGPVNAGLAHHVSAPRHFVGALPVTVLTTVSTGIVDSSGALRESSEELPDSSDIASLRELVEVDSERSPWQTRRTYQSLDSIDPSMIISSHDGNLSNRVKNSKSPAQSMNTDDTGKDAADEVEGNPRRAINTLPEGMLPIGFEVGLATSRRGILINRSEGFIAQTSLICEDLRLVDNRDRQRVLISDAPVPANSGSRSVYHAMIVQAVAALHIVWMRNSVGTRGVRRLFDPLLKRLRSE